VLIKDTAAIEDCLWVQRSLQPAHRRDLGLAAAELQPRLLWTARPAKIVIRASERLGIASLA
jgi:hypothetical protein